MFDPASSGASPSFLMRARSVESAGHDDDGRDHHRSAKARRAAQRPNTLLAALANSGKDEEPEEKLAARSEPTGRGQSGRNRPESAGARNAPSLAAAQPGAALVDPIAMLATIWRWRFFIVLCAFVGALVGVLVALATPHRYTAYSEVLIDPREVQLVGRDLEREFLANEAALAIVDSRLSLVYSRPVLERVIEATNLDQDAEFNGSASGGIGLMDGIRVITSLFGDETPVETTDRETLENLRQAIDIDRTTRTFVVTVGVEAGSPRKAAMLANEVTRSFVEEQASISSDKAISANNALTGRLGELQANVVAAERAIEEFRLENGLVSAQGRLLSDDDLAAASAQLAQARAATIRTRSTAEEASAITIDDAIAGSVPIDLNTPALTTFRAQHASLRQNAAQLENQLGPRHPRLSGAKAAIEAARQDIAAELTRIVQGAQSELRRAVQTEQELAGELARAKAARSQQSDALVTLRDLQAEAEAARAIYSGALLRSRETGEIGALGTVNAAILSPAEPPLTASSVSRRTIAIAFTLAGFLIGLGIAVLAGLRNAVSLDTFGTAAFNTPPNDPDPEGPADKRNSKQDTDPMHPGYPYAPSYVPQQAAAQPAHAHHPAPPYPQPAPAGYAPPQHPAAWQGHQPMPAVHPQSFQAPMPMAAPPQPWPPAAHYSAPVGYPPAPAPVQAPPHWHAPYPAEAAVPMPVANSTAQEAHQMADMQELRRSIEDIREVVEELAARRGNVQRFG